MHRFGCREVSTFRRLAVALVMLTGLSLDDAAFAEDRPYGPPNKTRSAVMGRHGMAATSQPLATMAAIEILQRGGNAMDAAIAANAVLGVVEPMSCGLGGDLFVIVWDARTKKLYGLNASGRSPAAATLAVFREKKLTAIPTDGPLSWSVPGCVDGWHELHRKFGSRPWSELFQPAIRHAEDGFPVSEIIAGDWKSSEASLLKVLTSSRCFLPDGHAPAEGTIFRNPELARSLKTVAEGGRDAFYRGPIAEAIVAYSKTVGGLFSQDDFTSHTSTWVDPVSINYRGYDVWELPPNGQGIAALQMLNLLERYDLRSLGFGSPQTLHLQIEAKKLAYEDRARYYADMEKARVPVAALISKDYANQRAALIDPSRANQAPAPGEPPQADTICMSVVDKDFNAVSLIQSNFHGFGSQHIPPGLGFALQNRGCLFAIDDTHPNRLEPRKRPFHTIIPGFVTKDGKPWLTFGLMGGDMQAQGHAQVICNLIDFDMDVQEAGDAPRFRHLGSSEPTGQRASNGGSVMFESGIAPEVRNQLEAMGHAIAALSRNSMGGYQAIRIDTEHGVLIGGSDSRKDGAAVGY